MSAKSKVLAYLSKDGKYNTLTSNKIQTMFDVKNVSATINELRSEGHSIYLNQRKTRNGDKVSYYRLGSPTKRVVAAGIMALRKRGASTSA
jgi:predicted transcriptional regulator